MLDPHGAVGYLALERYLQNNPSQKGIVLETAHPVKFYDVVEPVIGETIPLPPSVAAQINAEKKSTKINADAALLKDFLYSMA